MADPGLLPIADQPAIVPINTPEDTPRSRSGHASHTSHHHDTRTIASMSGDSTVLYGVEAAREGVPNNPNLNVMCQANLQQNFQRNEFTTNPTLNVVTHDPRITEMVESAAEARHQQVVSQIEMQAQSLQEALRIRENEELMRAREVMSSEAMQMRELVTREAEDEICRQQRNANATVEDYKRVMDSNLRQSISSKDQELIQLRDEALMREQRQNAEIQNLRNLVLQQAAANEKLQQMLQQSLRVPTNVNAVETATVTSPIDTQTAKAIPSVPPPGLTIPTIPNVHGLRTDIPQASVPMSNPVIVRDPITGNPILVSKDMGASFGKPSGRVGREHEIDSQANPTTPAKSPVPSVTGGLGGGGGGGGFPGGGDGDDDGSGGGGTPSWFNQYPSPSPTGGRKPRRSQLPGGGGGGGDPGGDGSDDSDDKFAKRLKKFLRSRDDEDRHDDRPKVKEADSIKIPAFPTPESYRNWRIKTREAVVAASTKPDEAFKW